MMNLNLPQQEIAAICGELDVEELALFGSALGEEFGADSDVDFLVVFANNDYGPWMGKVTQLQSALSRLLERKADVVPKNGIKRVIRDQVLAEAQIIYEKR